MKTKLLAFAACAALTFATSAFATDWKAVAVDNNGNVVYTSQLYFDEESARDAVVNTYEHRYGSTCGTTKSVPNDWTISVIWCDGSVSAGGARGGRSDARQVAISNAGGCSDVQNIFWF